MDASTIATIASATVSLAAPYLRKLSESAAIEVGKKAAGTAWEKTRQIYAKIRAEFSANAETEGVLMALEKSPDDPDTQAAMRFHLKALLSDDDELAKELASLLREASNAGADSMFNTTINGDVQKLVQMGNVFGDVHL